MHARRYISKRHHRKYRLRFKVRGTADRPRLSVFRSARHIYAQVIDDDSGRTLAAASTRDADLAAFEGNKIAAAKKVGEVVTQRVLAAGITRLVFDRNGFLYTGRVAAVSKAAHKAGLLTRDGAAAEKVEAARNPVADTPAADTQPVAEAAAATSDKVEE